MTRGGFHRDQGGEAPADPGWGLGGDRAVLVGGELGVGGCRLPLPARTTLGGGEAARGGAHRYRALPRDPERGAAA